MNSVTLFGNVTRDPEVKVVKANNKATSVATFGLAINRVFKKADGTKDQDTTFVECEAWDTGAETIGKFVTKGNPLLIEGSLRNDVWEKDGQKRSRMLVRVNRFYLMPKKDSKPNEEPEEVAVEDTTPQDVPF